MLLQATALFEPQAGKFDKSTKYMMMMGMYIWIPKLSKQL
jgi:hypothetical protein